MIPILYEEFLKEKGRHVNTLLIADKCLEYYRVSMKTCENIYTAEYVGCLIVAAFSFPFTAAVAVTCVGVATAQLVFCSNAAQDTYEICKSPD
jgi:transposase